MSTGAVPMDSAVLVVEGPDGWLELIDELQLTGRQVCDLAIQNEELTVRLRIDECPRSADDPAKSGEAPARDLPCCQSNDSE